MKRLTFLHFYVTEQSWEQASKTDDWRNSQISYNNTRKQIDWKNNQIKIQHSKDTAVINQISIIVGNTCNEKVKPFYN